jgi:cell division protein FtsB
MHPILLLATAVLVTAVLFAILFGRYAERGVKLEDADRTITALQDQVDVLTEQQERLTHRIENLEAIVTTEAWDELHDASLAPPEPGPEEKAAQLARRQRSG